MSTPSTSELLRSADGGPAPPDHAAIMRRGRRLGTYRTSTRVAGAVVAVAVLAGAALLVTSGPTTQAPYIDDARPEVDTPAAPEDQPAAPEETDAGDGASEVAAREEQAAGEPSQSPEDAQRDGIHPEIAARSFADRVDVDHATAGVGTPRIVTDEGVWVVSVIPRDAIPFQEAGPLVGDRDGLYGRDLIDLTGYGEVLLLDHDETRILRAFPFPDFPPQSIVMMDDAVYCSRQGDGGLPDSLLCRIDRDTFEWNARIFPLADSSLWFLDPDEYSLPESWIVDHDHLADALGELRNEHGVLVTNGRDGRRQVDPNTLELLGSLDPEAPTTQDNRLIEGYLAFARDPSPETAGAVGFADEVAIGLGPTLHVTVAADDLADPSAWVIDVPDFRAHVGPFSPLELAAASTDTVVTVGAHDHCASPPVPAPADLEDARRVSVQPGPDSIDTCLHWWTVDLYLDEDGEVAAVTMDLWEP